MLRLLALNLILKLPFEIGDFFNKEFIVFEPNNIKSVDNDGTWDIGDDNIFS